MADKTESTRHNDITLDIIRESGKEAHWLNRFAKDINTGEVSYYCEVLPDSELHIRRGSKEGPIVADVKACLVTPGTTDVNFSDPLYTVELEHLHHEDIPSMTRFSVNGKVYYWNGHAEMVSVETGDIIARFYPSWLVIDVQEHKLGKLVINEENKDLMDVAVTTALVVQERSDEGRQAIEMARIRSMEMGISPS